jgi:SnoaL-like domain
MATIQHATDVKTLVARYIEMWNEPDPEARGALVRQTLTEQATYVDPMASSVGATEISALIGAVQNQFPGFRFTLHSGPDEHHSYVRFSWALGQDAATPTAIGTDIAELGDDGRMRSVVGFLEPTP